MTDILIKIGIELVAAVVVAIVVKYVRRLIRA
jgi:hypothetical protein